MLDREKYNIEREKALRNQVLELSEYLNQFIKSRENVRDREINNMPTEEVLEKIRNIPIQNKGRNAKEVSDELVHTILDNSATIKHPRFFSFVVGDVSPYSLAGTILSDIYNQNACSYQLSPASATVEEKLISWAGERAGFDTEKCGGIFTSGGSVSNLTGMIAARECKLPGRYDLPNAVAFCSTQTHSSIRKGMRLMGLRNDQIVQIEVDEDYKIRTDLLKAAIEKAVNDNKKPFLIVGSLGTTNTGSIDPIDELADIAQKYGMWLHIDGAYGGSILVSDIYKNLAKGIDRADSFSWDFHKWMLQVYSCSCVVVKNKTDLINAFAEHPEYLEDVINSEHVDGWDLGIEMSRPARYIKLWYTLQVMGTDLFSDIVDYAFFNAKTATRRITEYKDWEVVSKPMCGTVNIRYAPKWVDSKWHDELNSRISSAIIESGYAYIVTTVLNGKKCMRLCMINGSTETVDVISTVDKLNEIAQEIAKSEEYKN